MSEERFRNLFNAHRKKTYFFFLFRTYRSSFTIFPNFYILWWQGKHKVNIFLL